MVLQVHGSLFDLHSGVYSVDYISDTQEAVAASGNDLYFMTIENI